MTTEEQEHGCVPIHVQIGDGNMTKIGTVPRTEGGGLNPCQLAAFFRAAADEIEKSYVRALKTLVRNARFERRREEEGQDHDGPQR